MVEEMIMPVSLSDLACLRQPFPSISTLRKVFMSWKLVRAQYPSELKGFPFLSSKGSVTHRFKADTFLGDFFLSFGRDRSCSNPSLSKSCLMAMLASCSISLNVSLMLRNTEKKCSLDRVLTLITSGRSSVAFFSS